MGTFKYAWYQCFHWFTLCHFFLSRCMPDQQKVYLNIKDTNSLLLFASLNLYKAHILYIKQSFGKFNSLPTNVCIFKLYLHKLSMLVCAIGTFLWCFSVLGSNALFLSNFCVWVILSNSLKQIWQYTVAHFTSVFLLVVLTQEVKENFKLSTSSIYSM